MNRKQRRALERKGEIPKAEPSYNMTPTQFIDANPTLKTILHQKVHEYIVSEERRLFIGLDTSVLWVMHKEYGFGEKRLKALYKAIFREHLRMREFYDLNDSYPEMAKLKEIGVDVEAMYNELFDAEGNYKKSESSKI